jgi:molecular chaperone GrpE
MDEKGKKENEEEVIKEPPEKASKQEILGEASASELEMLRQQMEAKELEAKDNYDRFLRQVADLENFKKRTAREKEEAIRYANESLIKDLLPVLDNLERAVDHAKGGGNGKPLLEGIEMVLKGFLDVLNKHGVTQISSKGEPFDPEKHQAIARIESGEHEPNTVVEEHHKGYYLLDRLIRPSLVSVAKEKKEEG